MMFNNLRNGPSSGAGGPGTCFPPPPPIAAGSRRLSDGGRGGKAGAGSPPSVGRPPPPPPAPRTPRRHPRVNPWAYKAPNTAACVRSLATPKAKKPQENMQNKGRGGGPLIRISGWPAPPAFVCGGCFLLHATDRRVACFFRFWWRELASTAHMAALVFGSSAQGVTRGRRRGATRRRGRSSDHYGGRATPRRGPGAGALAAPPPHPHPGTPQAVTASLTPWMIPHPAYAGRLPSC